MRLSITAPFALAFLAALTLACPARAGDGGLFGPPTPPTRAQIQQTLATKQAQAHTSMAKQISQNLNNDGTEAFTKQATQPRVVRTGFGRVIDKHAIEQKMYNPNDDSVINQNPFGRRPRVHYMFQRPGTNVPVNTTND